MANPPSSQSRNLKPNTHNPNTYSASPSQLTLPSDISSSIPPHQYQQAYPFTQHDPAGFFPQPAHPYRQPPQLAAQLPPPGQQVPPLKSPGTGRKRRASDIDQNQAGGSVGYAIPQHVDSGPVPHDVNLGQQVQQHHQQPGPLQHNHSTPPTQPQHPGVGPGGPIPSAGRDKRRTNTPWTPAEEQRLKALREKGSSWSDIAKTFPLRTEGSVKKHWYKDMHYAEFADDEVSGFSAALLQAIKEYDSNKWKVIGQKLGKPAKACETFAKDQGWKV